MLESILLVALVSAPPVSSQPMPKPVVFTPGPRFEGSLERAIKFEQELQFESISASMGDQEIPQEFLPQLEIEVGESFHMLVRDEALGESSHLSLRRTIEDFEGHGQVYVALSGEVDTDTETEATCLLAGESLRFERASVADEFSATLEGDTSVELPEELRFDLDLVALLPDRAVVPGERWEVGPHALDNLLEPGGAGLVTWSGASDENEEWETEEEPRGEFVVTFKGWVTGYDGELAQLEIEGEVSARMWRASDLEEIPVTTGPGRETRVDTNTWKGELIWNLSQGRMHSFDATAAQHSETVLATLEGNPGPPFQSTVIMLGEYHLSQFVQQS